GLALSFSNEARDHYNWISAAVKALHWFVHSMITLLGFAAGTLTTLSFIPQVHKVWRTKRGGDLSWGMLLAFFSGVVLWLIYGILLRAAPIITANAVTLALLLVIIVMKIRYGTER